MYTTSAPDHMHVRISIIFKNIVLFSLILLVAVVPLALRYYQDSRDYEIQNLASKLEFFAERGSSWLDPEALTTLTVPEHKQTPAYQELLETLRRIEREFGVDNAVVMRREKHKRFTFIAAGHDGFDIRQPVFIHDEGWFPETYAATNETWETGTMMHTRLFGGVVIDEGLPVWMAYGCRLLSELHDFRLWQRACRKTADQRTFGQFLQINTPVKVTGQVVAILMLNKEAETVAKAVRTKTLLVVGLSSGIVVVGLILFGFISARMLRPLKVLTAAAGTVAHGNLEVTVPAPHSRDEVGRLAIAFESMLEGLRQRDFIRDTFGRYISKEIVAQVLGSPEGLKLGGEIREVTFLVSDLRGFSTMASHLDPHTVITIINHYLEHMIEIILRYQGVVDEFQGDGILAFFGAPLAADDDPERAVACALEMQRAMLKINVEQRQRHLPELAMGIGIHIGQVLVGNIGSEQRTKYGAMGAPINTAYRIESYTVGGQILASRNLYERLQPLIQIRETMTVQFKGVDHPVTLYDVWGLSGRYQLTLPEKAPDMLTPLETPLPVACYPVHGKAVAETALLGYITELAEASARMTLTGCLEVHTNCKITLIPPDNGKQLEAYAKVVRLGPTAADTTQSSVALVFTSVAAETRAFLEQQRMAVLQAGQKHGL